LKPLSPGFQASEPKAGKIEVLRSFGQPKPRQKHGFVGLLAPKLGKTLLFGALGSHPLGMQVLQASTSKNTGKRSLGHPQTWENTDKRPGKRRFLGPLT
jgi:hypothetical protein